MRLPCGRNTYRPAVARKVLGLKTIHGRVALLDAFEVATLGGDNFVLTLQDGSTLPFFFERLGSGCGYIAASGSLKRPE